MILSSRIQHPRHVLLVDDPELNRGIPGVIPEENYELPDPMMPAQRL